jgi:hypothetical protein
MVVGIFLDPLMMKYPNAMPLSPLHSLVPRSGDAKLPPTQRRSPRPNSAWRKNLDLEIATMGYINVYINKWV